MKLRSVAPWRKHLTAVWTAAWEQMLKFKNKARCAGVIVCIFAAFSSLYGILAFARGIASVSPNIVVIMADDLDLGSFNKMIAESLMPNTVAHLIDQGITFTNAFVSTSLCCPSRATFLTGQYTHNHGVLSNNPPDGGVVFFEDSSTLATWLQEAGYRTGFVGKYLNGYGTNLWPNSSKDDPGYVPPGWNDWQALIGNSTYQVYGYWINDNTTLIQHGSNESDYQTDVLARRAADFIAESEAVDAQPFFLYVSPLAPHIESILPETPDCEGTLWGKTIRPAPRHVGTLPPDIVLPKPISFNEADLSDKPSFLHNLSPMDPRAINCAETQYRDRLGSLRAVDDMIGTIFDALAASGELDNSIVIFTSDNGYFHGEHRLVGKVFAYEEAIRVPLLFRPAAGTAPSIVDRFVINNDLAPTIAELAGATPGVVVDGRTFVPLLDDPSGPWRSRFLVSHLRPFSILGELPIPPFSAVRTSPEDPETPNKLFVAWQDELDPIEFYDLTNDLYQVESAHDDPFYEAERQRLDNFRIGLLNCAGETCWALEDDSLAKNPLCDIELNQVVYTNRDKIIADVARLANPTPDPANVDLRVWFEDPSQGNELVVKEKVLNLLPGFNQDFGPWTVRIVKGSDPVGVFELKCRLQDSVSGETLNLDVNPFEIQ